MHLRHRRFPRMQAEVIRDHILSVSGSLGTNTYGPSIPIGNRKKPFKDTPDNGTGPSRVSALPPPSGPQDLRPDGQYAKYRSSRRQHDTKQHCVHAERAICVRASGTLYTAGAEGVRGGPGLQIESVYRIALLRRPPWKTQIPASSVDGRGQADFRARCERTTKFR